MNLLGNVLGSLGGFIDGVPGPQLGLGSMFGGGGQGRKPSMLEMILGQLGGQLFGSGGMGALGGQGEEEEEQPLPLQGPGSDTGLARPVKTVMPSPAPMQRQSSYDSTPYANYLTRLGGGYGLR